MAFSLAQMTGQLMSSSTSGQRDVRRDTATVANPLRHALVEKASEEGDSAVEHAHKTKLMKYEERCDAEAKNLPPSGSRHLPRLAQCGHGHHHQAGKALGLLLRAQRAFKTGVVGAALFSAGRGKEKNLRGGPGHEST